MTSLLHAISLIEHGFIQLKNVYEYIKQFKYILYKYKSRTVRIRSAELSLLDHGQQFSFIHAPDHDLATKETFGAS
jgi:hypothetical protein